MLNKSLGSVLLAHSGTFAQDEDYIGPRGQLKAADDALQFSGFVAGVVENGILVFVQTERGGTTAEAAMPMLKFHQQMGPVAARKWAKFVAGSDEEAWNYFSLKAVDLIANLFGVGAELISFKSRTDIQ